MTESLVTLSRDISINTIHISENVTQIDHGAGSIASKTVETKKAAQEIAKIACELERLAKEFTF